MDHIVNPDLIISYGYTLQALGRDREAIDAYKEYLVTAPAGEFAGAALSNSANSWRKLKDDTQAENLYRQAIATEPTRPTHFINFIRMLFDQKRFDEAEPLIERAMSVARDDSTISLLLENQSAYYAEKMRGEDALRFAEAAIDRGATGIRAVYLRGRALALLGRLDESKAVIRQVLKIDPQNADGLRAMMMLDEATK
jgi:tetratricopeptide (TPR) repeat protein